MTIIRWKQPIRLTTGAWSDNPGYGHAVKFQNDAVEIYFLIYIEVLLMKKKKQATKHYKEYDSIFL